MLGDENKTIKAKAVNIIQKIRYAEEGNQEGERDPVRKFHLPRCNFAPTSYTDLIILKDNGRENGVTYLIHKKGYLVLHEPSLIESCIDIEQFVIQPLYPNYRNHTQAEKRAVTLTTTASGQLLAQKGRVVRHCVPEVESRTQG